MGDFDTDRFREKVRNLSDDELIALVSINASIYSAEALDIARSEIESRGLAGDVQTVIFDHFLNSAGFAGRLILLDEQIMFLSTGMKASGGAASGGLAGAIGSEAQGANRRYSATMMDFSALDNEGSWIYYLDQIKNCEAKSSLLSGKQLIFDVEETDGTRIQGMVKCGDLSKSDFENIPSQISEARSRMAPAG